MIPSHWVGDLIKRKGNASAASAPVDGLRSGARGINENTNMLWQQNLPKGIYLSVVSQDGLDSVEWSTNTLLRKNHGFKCPTELLLPDAFKTDEYYRRLDALHF